jgi:hypothetical protein
MKSTITELRRKLLATSKSLPLIEAANATGGLPVVLYIGGALVISTACDVVLYDWETHAISPATVHERRIAFIKAARRFPELVSLMPKRPDSVKTCPQCEGTGLILGRFDCGRCDALGWIAD